jgi:hypothetical protein
VAVLSFTTALYFAGRERQYVGETVRLRGQLQGAMTDVAELRQAAEVLSDPDVVRIKAMRRGPDAPSDCVYIRRGVGLVLVAFLSSTPPGKTYEMWFAAPGSPPAAAGLFQTRNDGIVLHAALNDKAAPIPGAEVIVTLENTGGASQPSKPLVVSVPVSPETLRQPR